MTTAKEQRIREAAAALHEAILDGKAHGLHVTWPRSADDLATIAVSATAKAKPAAPEAEKPKTKT